MKTDNIFKFVAVRPPQAKEIIVHLHADDKTSKDVKDLIKLKGKIEAVGSELVKSNRYFTATTTGKMLIPATRQIDILLRATRKKQEFDEFRERALALLEPMNSTHRPLENLLASDEYISFKQSLWLSYYANVLNPNELPQDREFISSWLFLFYLLEAKAENVFKARVQHLHHSRLAVPAEFFVPAPAPRPQEEPPREAEDALKRRTEGLRVRIAQLQQAHHILNDLYIMKLRKLEQIQVEEPVAQDVPQSERVMGELTLRIVGGNLPPVAPWRLTDEDLENYKQTLQLARELGITITPEISTLPEISNRFGAEIASLKAEVTALESREEIMLVGRTFVRVQRPRAFEYEEEEPK
jgi:hypothetical protein